MLPAHDRNAAARVRLGLLVRPEVTLLDHLLLAVPLPADDGRTRGTVLRELAAGEPLRDEAVRSADDDPAPSTWLVGIKPLPVARARPAVLVQVAAIVDGVGIRPVQRLILWEQREPVVLKATVAKKIRY
jgi:hypothetical protein